MKFLLTLITLSMMLSSCSQKSSDKISDAGGESAEEISISNLLNVDSLNVDNGTLTVDTQVNFSLSQKQIVTKLLKIKNTTNEEKALAVSISGDGFVLVSNRCGAALPAGKSCDLRVAFDPGKKFNNTYQGSLNITAQGSIPLSVVYNVSGNDAPATDGSVNDLQISMAQSFSGYVPSSLIPTRKIVVKNSTQKELMNISFDIDPKFGILINRCGTSLKAQESCSIIVFYKDIKNIPSEAQSMFRVSQNSQIKSFGMAGGSSAPAPEVYIATYSAYSPSSSSINACAGVVSASRTIVSCKKQSDNQIVANSFCSDLMPTVSYSSPEGSVVSAISHGSKEDFCHVGSDVVYNSVITCDSLYYLSGNSCLAQSALLTTDNSFGLNFTEYKSSGFAGYPSLDSVGGTPLVAPAIMTLGSSVSAGSSSATYDFSIANVAPSASIAPMISQRQNDTVAYARAYSSGLTSQACDSSTISGVLCSIDAQLSTIDIQVPKSILDSSGASSIKLNFNNNQSYFDLPVRLWTIEQAADTFAGHGASTPSTIDDNPRVKYLANPVIDGVTKNFMVFASNNEYGVQKLYAIDDSNGSVDLMANTSGSATVGDNIGVVFGKGNYIFFAAKNSQGRTKLFKLFADPVASSLTQISDLNASGDDIIGSEAVEYNNNFYLACGATVSKLCKFDPNAGTLTTVSNTSGNAANNDSPQNLFVFNNKLYFSAMSSNTVQKLHELNSSGQVSLIGGLRSATQSDGFQGAMLYNNEMYFVALKGSGSGMLKIYSMNTSGVITQRTNMNASINDVAGTGGVMSGTLRVVGTDIYFAGVKASGISKLYKLSTTTGVVTQISNITGSDASSDNISSVFVYGNEILFTAGTTQVKLYRLGSGGFIRQLTDIVSGGSDFPAYVSARGVPNSGMYVAMKNAAGYVKLMKVSKAVNFVHSY